MPDASFFSTPGRVAVTGHRLNRLPPPLPDRLSAACTRFFGTPHPECRLISCLADGTDLIAADAWPDDRVLETLLPVPVEAWRRIVSRSTDLCALTRALARSTPMVLLSQGDAPDYDALADRLVASCDRLFAVWDGDPGKPGGTGSVVARARAQGKPVLHLPLERLGAGG